MAGNAARTVTVAPASFMHPQPGQFLKDGRTSHRAAKKDNSTIISYLNHVSQPPDRLSPFAAKAPGVSGDTPGWLARDGGHLLLLMAMRLAFAWAFSVFGRVTVRTPFLNVAATLSSSTSRPRPNRRSKRP